MSALDKEQQAVVSRIRAIARKRKVSAIELKAAFATGLVESNLKNLPGGDRDSAGWRQERGSLYKNPTNLDASINRFFDETSAVKGKYKTAGELAAAVQRPAAQYRGRYGDVSKQAQALLEQAPPTIDAQPRRMTAAQPATQDVEGAMLDALLAGRSKRKGSLLQDVSTRIDSGEYLTPAKAATSAPPTIGATGHKTGGRSTPRAVVDLDVIPLARSLGINVTAESVSAANKRHGPTSSGGVSDHQGDGKGSWAGDFSNGNKPTKEMDKLARSIAKMYGIPWKGSGAVTHTANGYRYQLIYRSNTGGNHFNHVHFGVKKL